MRLVIALGGNALGLDPAVQLQRAEIATKTLLPLIRDGHELVLTHGNGPQVGLISQAFALAYQSDSTFPKLALPEAGAMSQGYIGYHLSQTLRNALNAANIQKEVVSIVTEVLVDKDDPAFRTPTKPIGQYFSTQPIDGATYAHFAQGYRRLVASPLPVDIIQKNLIKDLLTAGHIVITVGGGGIPVIKEANGNYCGELAVIDKDYASTLVARLIDADGLIILTDVDGVYQNYGQSNAQLLKTIKASDIPAMIEQKMFGVGSMLPKIAAAQAFVTTEKHFAIITNLVALEAALNGDTGTKIIY